MLVFTFCYFFSRYYKPNKTIHAWHCYYTFMQLPTTYINVKCPQQVSIARVLFCVLLTSVCASLIFGTMQHHLQGVFGLHDIWDQEKSSVCLQSLELNSYNDNIEGFFFKCKNWIVQIKNRVAHGPSYYLVSRLDIFKLI